MKRLVIASSVLGLAALAGCGSDPVVPAPAPVVVTPPPAVVTTPAPAPAASAPPATVVVQQAAAVRPGFGRVESITAAPASAAAGGQAMRRIGIKMEDGTMQVVDTAAGNIAIGERVELTSDGRIRQ